MIYLVRRNPVVRISLCSLGITDHENPVFQFQDNFSLQPVQCELRGLFHGWSGSKTVLSIQVRPMELFPGKLRRKKEKERRMQIGGQFQ